MACAHGVRPGPRVRSTRIERKPKVGSGHPVVANQDSARIECRAAPSEAQALTVPTPESARNWLRVLTAEPHVAGTPADYKTAVFVRTSSVNGAGRRTCSSWRSSSTTRGRAVLPNWH